MNIKEFLSRNKTLCISFEKHEAESLKTALEAIGFTIPENFGSPVILRPDKTLSFVRGFAANFLYSLPEKEFRKFRPEVLRLKYGALSPGNMKSVWYGNRI